MTDEPVNRILLVLGEFHDLAREAERPLHLCSYPAAHAQAVKHAEALQVGADAGIDKPLGLRHRCDRFGRVIASHRQQRVASRELERQFERPALGSISQARDHRETGVAVEDGLHGSRARPR